MKWLAHAISKTNILNLGKNFKYYFVALQNKKLINFYNGGFMSTYITAERISYFISVLQKNGKSFNTISAYSRNINKLVEFLKNSELSATQMINYKNWLYGRGFKKRTVNAYLAAANYFCEVMGWHGMKASLEPLDYDELQNHMDISIANYNKLLYTALQNNKERLAMMVQVLCHTDLRFCELGLLTTDILEKGYVEVTRRNKKIKIMIPVILIEDLNAYVRYKGIIKGIIFRTKNGSPVNRSNFCKDLKKICILAGIDENIGSIQRVKNVVLGSYPYHKLKYKN